MADRSITKCVQCHEDIPIGSRFCQKCGCRVSEGRICFACGTAVAETAAFCTSCGAAVSIAAAGPPPLPSNPTMPNVAETGAATSAAEAAGFHVPPSAALSSVALIPPPLPPALVTSNVAGAGTARSATGKPKKGRKAQDRISHGIGAAASTASALLPYGWRTIVGGTLPPFRPLVKSLSSAATKGSASVGLARSARGSAVFLALASAIELSTTIATSNTAAMATAGTRAVLALVATVAGFIAGRNRGFSSLIAVVAGLGLFLAQGSALMSQGHLALMSRDAFAGAMPGLLTQGASLLAALWAAWAAARK